jgi:hypothetical protein
MGNLPERFAKEMQLRQQHINQCMLRDQPGGLLQCYQTIDIESSLGLESLHHINE